MITSFAKKTIVSIVIFTTSISLAAQNKEYKLNNDKSVITILTDQKKSNFTIDNILRKEQGLPMIEAHLYNLGVDMDTVGSWSQLSTKENTWKFAFDVPGAKAFFIRLDDFYLPEGSKLYVYNRDNLKDAVLYTSENNPHGGPYSIENLRGSNAILEYVAPKNSNEKPRLNFTKLGYKYANVQNIMYDAAPKDDPFFSCMININCPQGADWQIQKKGVVYIRLDRINSGTTLCSGTLVNNTNGDKKPYILTADHCFENVDTSNHNNIEVLFGYESPDCENRNPVAYKYLRGAEAKVLNPINGGSDGALILLTNPKIGRASCRERV